LLRKEAVPDEEMRSHRAGGAGGNKAERRKDRTTEREKDTVRYDTRNLNLTLR